MVAQYLTALELNDLIHHVRFHRIAAENYVVCTLTMENGATIAATSQQGEQAAYKAAFDKAWDAETYLFHQRQFEQRKTEKRDLAGKLIDSRADRFPEEQS